MNTMTADNRIDRRFFVKGVGMMAASTLFGCVPKGERPLVRFGLVTDCHYAEIPLAHRPMPIGDASYRESVAKLAEAVAVFGREGVDFEVELGDFKDLGPTKAETVAYLDRIERTFAGFGGPRYHVFGNHDLDALTKDEFLGRVENTGIDRGRTYYSFVRNGVTFIVLDGCYTAANEPYAPGNWSWDDARVPPQEMDWLKDELSRAAGDVVVFVHQRVDPEAEVRHLMKNAAELRAAFESSGKVRAVFSGHQHSGGGAVVNGIVYYSLRGLVLNAGAEENSYAVAAVYPSGRIAVTGYRKAESIRASDSSCIPMRNMR